MEDGMSTSSPNLMALDVGHDFVLIQTGTTVTKMCSCTNRELQVDRRQAEYGPDTNAPLPSRSALLVSQHAAQSSWLQGLCACCVSLGEGPCVLPKPQHSLSAYLGCACSAGGTQSIPPAKGGHKKHMAHHSQLLGAACGCDGGSLPEGPARLLVRSRLR